MELFRYYLVNYKEVELERPELVRAILDFSEKFDAKEIIQKINKGNHYFDLVMPLDNSIFRLKRVGDSLAFQLRSGSGDKDIHEEGTTLIKKSCRLKGNNRWKEFIKRVVFTVPVAKVEKDYKARIVDLKRTILSLEDACPGIEWGRDYSSLSTELIKQYQANYQKETPAGEVKGVRRWLKLVHYHGNGQAEEKTFQYRKGNVSKVGGTVQTWLFHDGRDLFLQIGIDCNIEDSFGNGASSDIKTTERQLVLREWATAMNGQLYAMTVIQAFNKKS